ncbi:MAG TPA: N-acetyl-alpha-D-glucosaminyl L-malate synthase BshA [Candidatus Krumholzibacteria bacterium]|nr:N-acetyl-alpha-D-glucosaminyl L-malate synthase BshA [Candidatus Krumholzibacteria bacterium]
MKIGITCHTGSGGSGVLATELGLRLASRGHEVHFITRESPFRLRGFVDNVFLHLVETVYYPLFQEPPHTLSMASKMAETAVSYQLDVLHVHYAIPHAVSAYLAKQMLRPQPLAVVTTLHGTDITLVGNQPSFQSITRFCIEQSDCVTAVSEFLRQETLRTFEVANGIRVIHNFVDAERFRPGVSPELRRRFARDDEFILMHASNFRPVKNVRALVEIFARVQAEVPAKLVLIGEGPDLPFAKRRLTELRLADRVLFLGNQQCIEELLPAADLFLLPSHHESFGLAALEAMACGTVVLATETGGTREVIDHGRNGYLCPPNAVDAWTSTALAVLRDPAQRARLQVAAREAAVRRFAAEKQVAAYEEVYLEAMQRACAAAR